MLAIIFIALFSSAPLMMWPRALVGILWVSSWDICLSLQLQIALYARGQDWSADTCGCCSVTITPPQFPFGFEHLKAGFVYACHSTQHNQHFCFESI